MIINAGIKRVIVAGEYPDIAGVNLLREAKIPVIQMEVC
jgi:deoxycytidylate deaminase